MDKRNTTLDWEAVKQILSRHAMVKKNVAASPWDGLVLGNADMGAIIFGPSHKLCFRLGKMDLLDARWNAKNYKHPLPLSKVKEFVYNESKELKHGEALPGDYNVRWPEHEKLYPCMRMGADFLVRAASISLMPVEIAQRINLEDGLYEAEFRAIGWPHHRKQKTTCSAFISWEHNVLAVRIIIRRARIVVSLGREPWGGRSWELLSSGPSIKGVKEPSCKRDPRSGMLPPAEIEASGNTASLWQVIPGDEYCPERGFSIVATCAEKDAEFFMEPSGQAIVEGLNHKELTFFVAMCSEKEAPDSMKRAKELSQKAAAEGWDVLYNKHAEAWKKFWMKSAVELEEQALERMWVKGAYELAVNARSGRPAPGLFGVVTPFDSPPWKGDRHNNYPEYSHLFWGAFATNHEEQALNYTEFVHGYLPTARRIAREIFECEDCVAYPSCYIDGSEQYDFHSIWGWSLFLTALHAQECWRHYQYFGDRQFLESMAYPVMRECANFYVEMVKKNPPGDYTFWPTVATEIRGWTKDFELNKNCIEDLAHIKFLMRAVIEVSEILKTDSGQRKKWKDILDNLPQYPTIVIDGKEEFVDFAGQETRPKYNHSVPMAPFWPAEDPDIYKDARLRKIAVNTLDAHDWDYVRIMIAYMRLGLLEKVWERIYEFLPRDVPILKGGDFFVITEMLLTSWDGVIRVFPAWPLDKKARFRDLRAKGAFLVSAACEGGRITELMIKSEKGNRVRMSLPGLKVKVISKETGKEVRVIQKDNVLQWDTQVGEVFVVETG